MHRLQKVNSLFDDGTESGRTPMTVATLARRERRVRTIAIRPCSTPVKETATDKLARYRSMSQSVSHAQRGTDAEVNKDAAQHFKGWQDLRKQATRKA